MIRRSASRRLGLGRIFAAATGGVCLIAACEVPTSLPQWETTWVVSGDEVTMSVREILPASVTLAEGASVFESSLDGASFGRTLVELCADCGASIGTTAFKPAFTATFGDTVPLPKDVVSATIASGAIIVRLTNELGFDPIRPSADSFGTIRVRAVSNGEVLAEDTVDGEAEAFPTGEEREVTLALQGSAVSHSIEFEITVDSPEGDPVFMDAGASLEVEVAPGVIGIRQAEIGFTRGTVLFQPMDLDLTGLDEIATERIRGGTLRLRTHNPMAVVGEVDIRIVADDVTIERPAAIDSGSSDLRIPVMGAEIRSLAGKVATISASGIISAPSGRVTVTPVHVLVIEAELELILGPKED